MRSVEELPPDKVWRHADKEVPFSPDWAPAFSPRDESPSPRARFHDRRYRNLGNPRLPPLLSENHGLMEAAPFEEPRTQSDPAVYAQVIAAIEGMSERDRWIVEATIYRRLSVRKIGLELGLSKTHVHRLRAQAFALLQSQLAHLIERETA